jgi:hypothetical protein
MSSKIRKNHGHTIVEGAAMIPLLVFFSIALAFFVLNAGIVGTYNYRLNAIASEAARQMNAGRWWLGMERTGFKVEEAKNDVRRLLVAEVNAMGWEGASLHPDDIEITTEQKMAGDRPLNIVRVTFRVDGLRIQSAGVFPQTISLSAAGISSDAEYHVPRHAMAVLHVVDPRTGATQRAIRVPIYNATIGNDTPAHPKHLHAGPSIGTFPVVTMNIYAKTTGRLLLYKTDRTRATKVEDLGSWGPES